MLFQVHPHPATVRSLLLEELAAHPDCAASLEQEWELALPDEDYNHLVAETGMAARYLAASSFTRDSLVEHGVSASNIAVIPYGVDLERFHPATLPPRNAKLELLFVGRINQRKGVKYLLEALRLLKSDQVHLTICGRVVDDLAIFKPFASRITIRPSVSSSELVAAYQAADLFVFPSVAEGFAQVLLESLACGLPILSTTHTAAPDLIDDREQGFIVAPRRADLIAERIEWALNHRDALRAMRQAARERAERFTWQRFRARAAEVVGSYLALE
jgi:glycosyltransferase involved in cell wall biosynthesis